MGKVLAQCNHLMQRTLSLHPPPVSSKEERGLLAPGNCIKMPGNDSDWPCLKDMPTLSANHWSQGICDSDWLNMGSVPKLGGGFLRLATSRSFWKGLCAVIVS